MNIYFEFEANEIEPVATMSHYNYAMWRMIRANKLGVTHFAEVYDDVSDTPAYELGVVVDGSFVSLLYGEGDPVPEGRIGCGGVFTKIQLFNPEMINKA